jgi:iron complex outermembrane receptor protein
MKCSVKPWKYRFHFSEYIANLGLKFNPNKNFQFALMNQYVGKQYLDNNTEDKNLQLKDYFLTDFNAQYQFKIHNNDIALKLLVNNLFNKNMLTMDLFMKMQPIILCTGGNELYVWNQLENSID